MNLRSEFVVQFGQDFIAYLVDRYDKGRLLAPVILIGKIVRVSSLDRLGLAFGHIDHRVIEVRDIAPDFDECGTGFAALPAFVSFENGRHIGKKHIAHLDGAVARIRVLRAAITDIINLFVHIGIGHLQQASLDRQTFE